MAVYDKMGTSKNIPKSNEISNLSSVIDLILDYWSLLIYDYLSEINAVFVKMEHFEVLWEAVMEMYQKLLPALWEAVIKNASKVPGS